MSSPAPGSPAWYALTNVKAASSPAPGRTAMNAPLNKYLGLPAMMGNTPKLTINRANASPLTPAERRMKTNELDLLKKSAAGLMGVYKQTLTAGGKAAAEPMRIELLKNKKRIDALIAELGAKGGTRRKIRKLRKTRKNLR